jgi:hypothetical protein
MTDNRERLGKKIGHIARKCPWRMRSRTQCRCMSMAMAFDMRRATVSYAMPMATSLSQNIGVAGCGWPMFHVGQDFPLFHGDACGSVEAGVLRLGNKETDDRNASGVAGDGVVYPVVVVGEAEVAQAAGDAACVGAGEEGSV